jgi:hypothetical protein
MAFPITGTPLASSSTPVKPWVSSHTDGTMPTWNSSSMVSSRSVEYVPRTRTSGDAVTRSATAGSIWPATVSVRSPAVRPIAPSSSSAPAITSAPFGIEEQPASVTNRTGRSTTS